MNMSFSSASGATALEKAQSEAERYSKEAGSYKPPLTVESQQLEQLPSERYIAGEHWLGHSLGTECRSISPSKKAEGWRGASLYPEKAERREGNDSVTITSSSGNSDIYFSPDSDFVRHGWFYDRPSVRKQRKSRSGSPHGGDSHLRRGCSRHRSKAQSHSLASQTEDPQYLSELVMASTEYCELQTTLAAMIHECQEKDRIIESLRTEAQEVRAANDAVRKKLLETNEDIVEVCDALERSKKRSGEVTEQLASRLLQLRMNSTS
ncbi:hypothetical protein FOZ60_014633 [Perkinsus olseni]|uniref:Uncharacterized protein n=1 Tax=Perkinsus olseni TaxID=32597 RepID=A0A7J6QGR4_PEROL|nr:hypothetical protein FOZ60_014633 [Perkinsus olseni]KAF4706866.1 hypothetical protein FOZ62_016766 [Perkinsus olseni]